MALSQLMCYPESTFEKKKSLELWCKNFFFRCFFFFFHLNAVWSTSVTRPLHRSLTVKNRETPDNKALVFIVTDVRMWALTSRNRSLMGESEIRFLCDSLGFAPMMGEGLGDLKDLTLRGSRITQISSPNSHRWISKRLQSGLFSDGWCIAGPISENQNQRQEPPWTEFS